MNEQTEERWRAFRAINEGRRAIRDFDGRPVPDQTVRELLAAAMLAPSSRNAQGYELHWIRDAHTKAAVTAACRNQRAAASAATLIVVVAGRHAARRSMQSMRRHVETTGRLDAQLTQYSLQRLRGGIRFLSLAALPLWDPLQMLLCQLFPSLTLLPVGAPGLRHWLARSSLYAAQTLLLGASAYGIDSCPMEGFNPRKVARVLGLTRGSVIPIIIALGYRRPDARVDPRWRRTFDEAVVIH